MEFGPLPGTRLRSNLPRGGIDVAKAHLEVYCHGDGRAARFGNDAAGFRKFKAWLPQTGDIARVVCEATGSFHAAIERRFGDELPLVKVYPLQARRFAQSVSATPTPSCHF